MFRKESVSKSFVSILFMLLIKGIAFCSAQQNSFVSELVDKSGDHLMASNAWNKLSNVSHDLSQSLQQSVQTSKSMPHLIRLTAVACYECNSYFDPDCITNPEMFSKNCTNSFEGSQTVGCRKIDQWVDYDEGTELKAHHRVIRQCASDGDISKPCYYRAGYGGRINACFCDSDLCNSGHPMRGDFILALIMFSVVSIGFSFNLL